MARPILSGRRAPPIAVIPRVWVALSAHIREARETRPVPFSGRFIAVASQICDDGEATA